MEIVFSGFGGQGVLTSGLIVAYIALKNDYEVLWSPSYGAQVRGGKAYSMVKFDREQICEPNITGLDVLVAMNKPSLDFASQLKPDGLLIVNSNTVEQDAKINFEGKVLRLPINDLATELNNPKAVNVISVGVVIKAIGIFDRDAAIDTMCQFFEDKGKGKFNESNRKAFITGYNYF